MGSRFGLGSVLRLGEQVVHTTLDGRMYSLFSSLRTNGRGEGEGEEGRIVRELGVLDREW